MAFNIHVEAVKIADEMLESDCPKYLTALRALHHAYQAGMEQAAIWAETAPVKSSYQIGIAEHVASHIRALAKEPT